MQGIGRRMFQVLTGYIYFVQMDYIGPIKIGIAKNVQQRMRELQTGSPYRLNLLCCFPGNEDMEREIHLGFSEIKLEGEWFLPHPFLLREIRMQIELNKKHNFVIPNPERDLGDFTLASEQWNQKN